MSDRQDGAPTSPGATHQALAQNLSPERRRRAAAALLRHIEPHASPWWDPRAPRYCAELNVDAVSERYRSDAKQLLMRLYFAKLAAPRTRPFSGRATAQTFLLSAAAIDRLDALAAEALAAGDEIELRLEAPSRAADPVLPLTTAHVPDQAAAAIADDLAAAAALLDDETAYDPRSATLAQAAAALKRGRDIASGLAQDAPRERALILGDETETHSSMSDEEFHRRYLDANPWLRRARAPRRPALTPLPGGRDGPNGTGA